MSWGGGGGGEVSSWLIRQTTKVGCIALEQVLCNMTSSNAGGGR